MTTAALRARYLGDSVQTASPQRLLVMAYDRLALDLVRAEAHRTAARWVLDPVGPAVGNVRNNSPELVEPQRSLF